jgi:hypothetical protein
VFLGTYIAQMPVPCQRCTAPAWMLLTCASPDVEDFLFHGGAVRDGNLLTEGYVPGYPLREGRGRVFGQAVVSRYDGCILVSEAQRLVIERTHWMSRPSCAR